MTATFAGGLLSCLEVYDLLQLSVFLIFFPEVLFHSSVTGASLATTDSILATS